MPPRAEAQALHEPGNGGDCKQAQKALPIDTLSTSSCCWLPKPLDVPAVGTLDLERCFATGHDASVAMAS